MRWIMVLYLWTGQIVVDPKDYTQGQCYELQQAITKGEIKGYKGVPIIRGECILQVDV